MGLFPKHPSEACKDAMAKCGGQVAACVLQACSICNLDACSDEKSESVSLPGLLAKRADGGGGHKAGWIGVLVAFIVVCR